MISLHSVPEGKREYNIWTICTEIKPAEKHKLLHRPLLKFHLRAERGTCSLYAYICVLVSVYVKACVDMYLIQTHLFPAVFA